VKISPLDIRKQTFRTVFRGADGEEVRVFLDLVATEYENTLQENQRLAERLHHCEDRLAEYRELDQTLRNSLLTAERLAAEAKQASQHEAEMVLQDAEWRAKQILEDARERLGRLAEEIRDLQSKKESFSQHLRSFLQAQMDLLDRNENYLEGIDRLADDIHEMASRARQATAKPASPQPVGATPAPPDSVEQDLPDSIPPEAPEAAFPPSTPMPEQAPRSDAIPGGQGPGSRAHAIEQRELGEAEGPAAAQAPDAGEVRSSQERSEGLFEISAEEDYPQRT
jgi:cell division initiation protein